MVKVLVHISNGCSLLKLFEVLSFLKGVHGLLQIYRKTIALYIEISLENESLSKYLAFSQILK